MRLNPRKRKRRSRRAAGAVAGGVAVAATATYLVTQRRHVIGKSTTGRGADGHEEFRCACGQEFRVTGSGRHRVFWLPDARPEDPVLDDRCPNCDRTLSLQD